MELSEAIRHILDGNAVLFVGSGFSAGAVKEDGNEFSTAKPLAHLLLSECGYGADTDDLGQASELYKDEKGEIALVDFVRKEFTAVDITKEQTLIGSLPWKRIYTTNYDNVLEIAYQRNKRRLDCVVLSNRPQEYKDKKNLCIHLNGKVTSLTEHKLNDEFKLTNTSYLTESFLKSPWIKFFQTDLQTAKAVFFLGYSMKYDLDIQRLVYAAENLKEKTFLILWNEEPRINLRLIARFGTPLAIGINGLTDKIEEIRKTHIARPLSFLPFLCFKKHEISNTPPNILDRDVFNFYFRGNYGDENNIFYSLQAPINYPFCIYRSKLDNVLSVVEDGERNIVVHSSLGNGKSIFLMELATLLTHQGYNVFSYQKYRTTINDEIERICKGKNPTAIIFDKYGDCREYLETFNNFRSDQLLIVAERSSINDIYYDRLVNCFGEFYNVDLSKLEEDEINQLISVFNHYGLWADYSSFGNDQKYSFITRDCHCSISKFILKILHSEHIIKSFADIASQIRAKKKYYDAIIFILISQVSGFDIDMDDLVNALDASQLNSPSFKNNPLVKEFVDFNGSSVKPMSSIVANVLLSEIFNTDVVIDVMIRIFKQLNEIRSQKGVSRILHKMMNFSNLQNILNKEDKEYKFNLIRFFEEIRPLSECAENPHFWLQYAILKLSDYDYKAANVYFKNAYAFAKKRKNFDTYQIDNHHARFLLENEVEFGSQYTCMQAFESAHNILIDPKHKEDSYYYPYRVAQNYYPFYEKFYSGMNTNEKKIFVNACEEMLERTEWYLRTHTLREGRKDVKRAQELLSIIIKEVINTHPSIQ